MKTKMKRSLSLFLAVILCLSSFMGIGVTAFAAEKRDVYLIDLPRGKEPNKSGWGHPALELMNGWSTFDTDYVTVKALGDYEGNSCYCIEPGVPLYTGDSLSKEAEDFWDNYPTKYNKSIVPDDIKIFIGRIMQYGYTGKNSVDWISTNSSGADDCANHLATQLLIWETVIGERDENFNKINAHDYGKKNIKEIIQSNHPLKSKIFAHYDRIEESVKNHTKTPSFTAKSKAKAKTIELKWNGKNYSADLTDSNKVLANYDFSASGLTFKKSGNVLTVTAEKAPKDEVLVTADKKNGSRKNAEKGIRFVDSRYKKLFTIPDGEKIQITFYDGRKELRTCRYIDECHLEVGNNLYHTCEFADKMVDTGNKVIPMRSSLPERCYTFVESENTIAIIKKGCEGYYPTALGTNDTEKNKALVKLMNAQNNILPNQAEAMKAGSMFGWETPAADPKNYDKNGIPIKANKNIDDRNSR